MRLGVAMMAFCGAGMLACGSDDGGGTDTTIAAETTVTETAVTETAVTETAVTETAVTETAVTETAVTETVTETAVETTPTPRPGRILVAVTNVTGWQGKALVALTPDNGARLCASITTDPFSLPATPLTAMAGNPCGPASADVVFQPGTHVFTLAVVTPGNQTADASIAVSVEVDGDVTVTVDGAKLKPATGSPGTISVSSTPITGQSGRIVILSVQSATAGICVAINSDAFSLLSAKLLDLTGAPNPCEATGAAKSFPAGSYIVTAGVYVPGEHTPSASTAIAVDVDGDVTAIIDGTKLSR